MTHTPTPSSLGAPVSAADLAAHTPASRNRAVDFYRAAAMAVVALGHWLGTVVVLRHGKATPREDWKGKDAARPLTDRGKRQAKAAVGPLRAFGIRRVVSSDAVRCVDTVAPLAKALGRDIRRTELISQDAWEEGHADVRAVVGKRVRSRKAAVLCSHRPVIPTIMSELALATGSLKGSYIESAADLEVGGFSVAHLSATNPGSGIVAIETHPPKV